MPDVGDKLTETCLVKVSVVDKMQRFYNAIPMSFVLNA